VNRYATESLVGSGIKHPIYFVWGEIHMLNIVAALAAAAFAALCWWTGPLSGFADVQRYILIAILLALNVAPPLSEILCKRFDPFDAKHLFLIWYFIVFTLSSVSEICFGFYAKPALALVATDRLELRALSAMVLGLAGFILGCYVQFGERIAGWLPRLPSFSEARSVLVGGCGIAAGTVAFFALMASEGGISSFVSNLGSWRTTGVLGGVGYYIFPATTVLPAASMLIFLRILPNGSIRLHYKNFLAALLVLISWLPILILGFRISFVPMLVEFIAIWHYERHRISLRVLAVIATVVFASLSLYGALRDAGSEGIQAGSMIESIVFRTSGIDAVERVIRGMDLGEPARGIMPAISESLTILMPRALWPEKPQSAGLKFDEIFFYDFYIERGDPIDGLKSGISTTLIGEELWTGGIPMVLLGSFALGVLAQLASSWRMRGGRLHLFIYLIFMGNFFIFVEAPQNALNNSAMLSAMCIAVTLALIIKPSRNLGTVQRIGLSAD
jgi:oligosaccharide repeat unit polymerase